MKRGLLVLVSLLLITGLHPVTADSQEYGLTIEGSIDTPEKERTYDGKSYSITAIKQVDAGDSTTVSVTAPEGEFVEVYLYNKDKQIQKSKDLTGSGTVTFDLPAAYYPSGSYIYTLQHDGSTKAVHPLVIRAYDVTLSAPAEATVDSSIDLSATVTQLHNETLQDVEFVVANETTTLRRTDATSEYAATIDLDQLSPGDYSVYANARGTETVDGTSERLGLSEAHTLSITAADSSNEDESTGGGGGGGAIGGGGGVDPSTATPATTAADTTDTQQSGTTATPPESTGTAPKTDRDTPQTPEPATDTATATADGVITPEPPTADAGTDETDGTTTGSGPGFGVLAALVGVLLAMLIATRAA